MRRKKGKWLILFLILLPVVSGVMLYYFFPQSLLTLLYKSHEWRAGVKARSLSVEGYEIPYYDGGEGEPLVLIHGFGDSKISFVQTAKWLTPHYRVILPEVPGFGATKHDLVRDYSIHGQVQTLHKFFNKLGLRHFHLGGNSMGGHISVAYALTYPNQVISLLVLDASGIEVDDSSPFAPVEAPVRDEKELQAYLQSLFYKVPFVPRPFRAHLIAQSSQNFSWLNSLRTQIREGKDYLLDDRIVQVKAPTLIVWGDHDTVVKVGVGDLYRKRIAGSKWVLMENCGHAPQYERPKETAHHLSAFLREVDK